MKTSAYNQIINISQYYFDPDRAMRLMLNLVKAKEKQTKKTLSKIFLQRLTERKMGTRTVEVFVNKMFQNNKRNTELRKKTSVHP